MPDFGQPKGIYARRVDFQFQCRGCYRLSQPGSIMVWWPVGGRFEPFCISCATKDVPPRLTFMQKIFHFFRSKK